MFLNLKRRSGSSGQKSSSNKSFIRGKKFPCLFIPSFILPVNFDLLNGALLILCLFSNHFVGHVLGKPGSGEAYVQLGQNNPTNFNYSNPTPTKHSEVPVPANASVELNSPIFPESIRASLSSLCENCTDLQTKKLEQILLLLFNFNRAENENKQENFSSSTSSPSSSSPPSFSYIKNRYAGINKPLRKLQTGYDDHGDAASDKFLWKKKKLYLDSKKEKSKFRVTSIPKSLTFVPTPQIQYYHSPPSDEFQEEYHGVIQLPTTSTTPSSLSSSSYAFPSRVLSNYPPYKSVTRSSSSLESFPLSISTTVSSALGPFQSVEMPTPPMPPTTSGPIYLYYMSSPKSKFASASSSSLQTPTTPVVESSLASRPTTLEP